MEELPPVLVLHLKRFVFEKTGGCQKLTKNIDYPVDLEISKGMHPQSTEHLTALLPARYQNEGQSDHTLAGFSILAVDN